MKYKWLQKNNNTKLIIFFNGWGMDETVVSHLEPANYDVLMFYDYNSLETNFDFKQFANYSEKYLVAWSMGVMIATNFEINYNSTTAINGTLEPIHEKFGIHPKIYDLTIQGFNENGRKRFLKSIFDTNCNIAVQRDISEQKTELVAIKNYKANKNFKYNKIYISDNDKIIPTKNQIAYWNKDTNIQSPHCPFPLFKTWEELL
jgi:biotin synthesis protein BioG